MTFDRVAAPEQRHASTPEQPPAETRRRRLRAWVAHPFLLAAYPVLFLFSQNTSDQLSLDPMWLPLLAAVGGAAITLAVLTAVYGDVHRAGIATSLLVVAFFSFGHVRNLIGDVFQGEGVLLAIWVALITVGLVATARIGSRARAATAPLNLVAAIAVMLPLLGLGQFALARGSTGVADPVSDLLAPHETARPDIYYLVPDRYLGSPALERHFGFDNEPFLQALEDRGFYVARDSVANYGKTNLSLTSSLEMEYLDADALNAAARSPADQEPINRAFQGRLEVPSSLKALGYDFVLVPSWWPPTASNVDADLTLRYEGASEFTLALLDTTMWSALSGPGEELDPFSVSELRNYTLHQIEQMLAVPRLPAPKFVMAHFALPHPPYVFDRDGSPFEGEAARLSEVEKYIRQMEFTNSQILRMVDAIRAGPGGDEAVIVIQADEGPFPPTYGDSEGTFQWAEATPVELEIKFRILNALRIPAADPHEIGLTPSLTPVNEFRVVFNAVFDAGMPMLPDHVYTHTDYEHFYDFIEITDRIPGWPAAGSMGQPRSSSSAVRSSSRPRLIH